VSLSKIFALTSAALLAGCATTPTVISDYCQSYRVIQPSRKDTADTLRQIATENAKFRAVCAPGK
jgi:uncharacterized lipoprotein YajG